MAKNETTSGVVPPIACRVLSVLNALVAGGYFDSGRWALGSINLVVAIGWMVLGSREELSWLRRRRPTDAQLS